MEKKEMSFKKIAFATALSCAVVFGVSAVQAKGHHAGMHHASMHHHHGARGANPAGLGEDIAAGAAGATGGYYASSAWGDYDCRPPHGFGCARR
jgi:hypothetical protein